MIKRVLPVIILIIFETILFPSLAQASTDKLWEVQSIDTMKYSRDASRNPIIDTVIPIHVKAIAETGANFIAIDTPYDDEFIPVLKKWVDESRKYNLRIWFRGNFSGWEGWFDYPLFTDYTVHHDKTYRFITQNPDLFLDGDIFTPSPELENGVIGDPRRTGLNEEFNQFLVDSYKNCNKSFSKIKKQVSCDYYSMNPDVIRERVTKETIKKIGGILAIDHYVKSPERMESDVKFLSNLFGAKVFLSEFGAPIPDIHGVMTEQEQSDYIQDVLNRMYLNRDFVVGMNYWVIAGGSTTLLNDDSSERLALKTIKNFYDPAVITGVVRNDIGESLKDVKVAVEGASSSAVYTDKEGAYKLVVPVAPVKLEFSKDDFKGVVRELDLKNGSNSLEDLKMEIINPDFWYSIKLFFDGVIK